MKIAKLVLLGGFLGAGKTTTLINSALHLEKQGYRVAIVTNDQGKELIDTELARKNGLETKEVTGGCFCCQFEDLYENLSGLLEEKQPDVIIAEAVGSCTDLAATVIQPLKQYYSDQFKTAPLTIVVDPARLIHELNADETRPSFSQSVSYIFEKQLAEADIIALNKLDRYSDDDVEKLYNYLQQRYPQTLIQTISAERGDNLEVLTETWLSTDLGGDKVLDIDYDRYAEGEAQLAWMNILGDLSSEQGGINPQLWAERFLEKLNTHFIRENMAIAHLKVHVGLEDGYVKASMVHTGDTPTFTVENVHDAKQLRVVLNIRIEATPAILNLVVADAIGALNQEFGTKWSETYNECFSPLPPKPVHRLYEVI